MGTGSSVQPKHGVLPNPRLMFADTQSKKLKKNLQIDAPVLIDLQHGSIRYRYVDEDGKSSKKKEKPHEGEASQQKGHYFYHARLNDFSEKASEGREDPHKFMYVVKGPTSAKQKKVFYVFGRSLDTKDGDLTKPTSTQAMDRDPNWPQRQNPNDVYYNLTFIKQVPTEDPISGIPNRYQMQYAVSDTETVDDIRRRIANTIIKSASNVHVCFQYKLLKGENVIAELGSTEEERRPPATFGIHLVLMER